MINGKKYIGQTVYSLNKRIKEHLSFSKNINKRQLHFHRALNKYGIDNFTWEIIAHAPTKLALDKAEIYWIKFLGTMEIGYNHQSGGSSGKLSSATKKKLSIANSGRILSEDWKQKISDTRRGQKIAEVTKMKMRKPHRKFSEITKKKMSESRKGIKFSPETCAKMSRVFKGRKAWNKGISMSPEACFKMSESQKKYWSNEENRKNKSEVTRKAWADPETRRKMIEARWRN